MNREVADYTEAELRTALATLCNRDPAMVCRAVAVLATHKPEGGHELFILADDGTDVDGLGALLSHGARHLGAPPVTVFQGSKRGCNGAG